MKPMKFTARLTALLLTVLLCLSLLPASVLAVTLRDRDTASPASGSSAEIILSGKCGDNVSFTLTDDGVLTISGTGAMYDYEETFDRVDDIYYVVSSAPWGSHHLYELTHKLVIEPGVTHIGSYAFGCMRRIESVALPNTLQSIGDHAFYHTGIRQLVLPNSITEFGEGVFRECWSLTSVQLPNKLTRIRINMFRECWSLQSIVIPDSVTVIGDSAFRRCYNLETVVMPSHPVKVYRYSFEGCPAAELPTVTKQPENCLVQMGEKAVFSAEATGQNFTYTWYYRNPGDREYTRTNRHEPTYEIKMTEARNGRKMYCRVTNQFGQYVDTKTVVMGTTQDILDKKFIITLQPKDIQVEQVGDLATLKIGAKTNHYKTYYYWYYKNPGMKEFQYCDKTPQIPTYSIRVTEARNGRQMYCKVYNNYDGSYLTSDIVTLTYKNASPGAVPEDEE